MAKVRNSGKGKLTTSNKLNGAKDEYDDLYSLLMTQLSTTNVQFLVFSHVVLFHYFYIQPPISSFFHKFFSFFLILFLFNPSSLPVYIGTMN